ncbi:putative TRAP dicarboxylate transporter, DctP subunit [uncultured delta proteobacterium]|uniref:Putative TRAP dicarboxylate transporter, DctP subunit n=1 Tax=uncultured delta proteobacterium TaxID=34034 RepID=A0A212K2H5_9DELT|nr:putative TRAP dicarboxylate transporter, DctP subunit [uncultured delta proteobacterium]
MKRFSSVLLTLCMLCGFAFPAHAAEQIVVSFANGMAPTHAANIAFEKFAKEIEKRSNGEIVGVAYPNNQLGSDTEAMQAIQDHTLVMTMTATPPVVSFVPAVAIFDMPFFFASLDEARKAVNDPELMKPIEEGYKTAGLMNLGFDPQGYRWLSSKKKAITTLEDLKGFKLRISENPQHRALWTSLGATPTPLANSERYTALQQGTVDGQENVMENAYNTKMYEVQDYFMNTKHITYITTWLGDPKFYESLKPEHQKLFMELIGQMRADFLEMSIAREEDLLKELETKYKKTVIREMPAGEYERWAKIARPVVEKMIRGKIGDDLVDKLYRATGKTK